ncbi:MAG: ribosome maturation factor [Chitinophagales bacterium]
MLKSKIENRLNDYVEGTDLFFVDVKITPQQKITLFVDGKQNITIDKCAEISRMLEAYLEEEKLVGEKYTLEVSSPGMLEPFKVIQQYQKSIDRLVEVLKKDGNKYQGILKKVEEDGIQLEAQTLKNKKVVATNLIDIPFEYIKATKKLITFK